MVKRAGGDVCVGPLDREKHQKCVKRGSLQAFQKILSRNDIEEGHRVDIPKSDANECRLVEAVDVIFYDDEKKSRTIRLRSDGGRYLSITRGWSQFARVNKLSEGDTITIYKLKSPRGQTKGGANLLVVGVTCNGRLQHFKVDLTKTQQS